MDSMGVVTPWRELRDSLAEGRVRGLSESPVVPRAPGDYIPRTGVVTEYDPLSWTEPMEGLLCWWQKRA